MNVYFLVNSLYHLLISELIIEEIKLIPRYYQYIGIVLTEQGLCLEKCNSVFDKVILLEQQVNVSRLARKRRISQLVAAIRENKRILNDTNNVISSNIGINDILVTFTDNKAIHQLVLYKFKDNRVILVEEGLGLYCRPNALLKLARFIYNVYLIGIHAQFIDMGENKYVDYTLCRHPLRANGKHSAKIAFNLEQLCYRRVVKNLSVDNNDRNIVFISSPLVELGLDKHEENVVNHLSKFCNSKEIKFIVKLHPRDPKDKFVLEDHIIILGDSRPIEIIASELPSNTVYVSIISSAIINLRHLGYSAYYLHTPKRIKSTLNVLESELFISIEDIENMFTSINVQPQNKENGDNQFKSRFKELFRS